MLHPGHATAEDLVLHFRHGVFESGLSIKGIVQISMDGPNVNWKFYKQIRTQLQEEYSTSLINIGSCGLHIVHNAFKAGVTASGWIISSFLTSLYYLFKDCPARREDYTTTTGFSVFPLKFVSHRWLENVPVAERALEMVDSLGIFVRAVKDKSLSNPGNNSFDVVDQALSDPLLTAKLHFFFKVLLIN